ncbi:MAG: helicase HerA-like domain-containing protein [Fimbriimonadaceae bacterium]|nr:helicase HerA-like domain-containing protein [Fimbriimonadaceae bacterium]
MSLPDSILIGKGESESSLLLKYANRHGLIAGATGTGKTVTLQRLAEQFSRAGVPVFMADVKGDLTGIAVPGGGNEKVEARAKELGLFPMEHSGCPTVFWDVFGEQGHPVRATVSEMGPLLLSRMLDLNDTQEGVLNVAFEIADDQGLLLLDLKDLRAILAYVAENAKAIQAEYGNVSSASVGAIQRQLLVLEQQGAEQFFGEPALELADLMRKDPDGQGYIHILMANRLMQSPRLYATFLLWLLSELFEELPEVGDLDRPKLVFFFDEAHLLFNDAPKALLEKVEQVVRLIRSKGVGVYFVTQNPIDVPETVLGQLGNRVQHALRAFTPRDQKGVRAAAETFRANAKFKTDAAILELVTGEALVSVLDAKGAPTVVDRVKIAPPVSRIGPAREDEKSHIASASPVRGKYDAAVDVESAFEILRRKADAAAEAEEAARAEEARAKAEAIARKEEERLIREHERTQRQAKRQSARQPQDPMSDILTGVVKSVTRSAGSQLGRQLVRGILGGLMRGR